MTRLPRKDNPAPELPNIWAAHHCRRDVPTEGQIAAVSALVILATVIVIAGLVSWAFA
jgi:hypothetical protein